MKKNKNSRFLAASISCLLIAGQTILSTNVVYAIQQPTFQHKSQSAKFLEWNYNLKEANSTTKPLGFLPSPVSITKDSTYSNLKKDVVLPSKYDLRTLGRVTPVKNQGEIGSCWAFAAYSALESVLLSSEGKTYDFSENNLITHHGFNMGPDDGGNRDMFTAYLTRWTGPINEADDPYPQIPIPQNVVYRDNLPTQKHVQDVVYLPARLSSTDNYDIKKAVMDYGAVDTSIYYDNQYYNNQYKSYYVNTSAQYANHEITIVGWDDNYAKENFSPNTPSGNGAFICRNNWGNTWGDGGYFYISYYDEVIGTENTVFTNTQPVSNYHSIYQYDPLGMVGQAGFSSNTAWISNVFTQNDRRQEKLAGVSFYTTKPGAQYEVYVQSNYATNKFSNLVKLKTGTIAYPGYHTVALDSPITLPKEAKFAAIVKLNVPGESYPVAVESRLSQYSDSASANAGESFASFDGTDWLDISDGTNENVCLKAFTSLVADLNGDQKVDILDIALEAKDYNMKSISAGWNKDHDVNQDNIVDLLDLTRISKDMD